jgi:hypothetical protein
VIVELLAHLRSTTDPVFQECLSAVCAVWSHCRLEADGSETLGLLSDSETQLCRSLYRDVAKDSTATHTLLRGMVQEIAADPTVSGIAGLHEEIDFCATAVEHFEQAFVDSMTRALRDYDRTDPAQRKEYGRLLGSNEGRLIGAAIAVNRARAVLGLTDVDPEHDHRVVAVANQFPVATSLQAFKLRQMAIDGLKIAAPKHRNSAWDIDICYCIGQTIAAVPIVLVTADTDIVRRARAVGQHTLVQTLDAYLTLTGLTGPVSDDTRPK